MSDILRDLKREIEELEAEIFNEITEIADAMNGRR